MIEIVNKICNQLPEGWLISLEMESGAAWVDLYEGSGIVELPDPTDKTIIEQLNDALCMSKGFKP